MDGALDMMSGLEKIRGRFLDLLVTRQQSIAHHAVLAYEGQTLDEVNGNLAAARDILHQIAGTAGSGSCGAQLRKRHRRAPDRPGQRSGTVP